MKLLAVIILTWNAQPDAKSFKVYKGIEVVASINKNEASLTIPFDEASSFTVTAINEKGESEHSETITIRPEIKLTIQGSKDLQIWQDIPKLGDNFFRVKTEKILFVNNNK